MIKLLWSGFIIMCMVSGCGYNGTPTRSPQGIIPPTSIEIVPDSSKIAVGTSTKLTAYGYFAGVRSDITDLVDWSIDPTTATVAEFKYTTAPNKNRVSGIASGTAKITATFDGVTSAPISLTVSSATVSSIAVTPVAPSVIKGDSQQFIAKGTFPSDPGMDNGWIQDLTFDAIWESSDTVVATVISGSESNNGLATGVSKGTATITAKLGVGGIPGTATLTVIELQSIAVTPNDSSVAGFAKTVQFIATGTYSDGSTKDISSTVTWDSSQKSFATIASSGLATTVAAGTTSISATLNGIPGSTNLTVTAAVPTSLQITPVNPTLSISTGITTLQLTATAFYADNPSQIVTSSSTWEISPPSSIATVNTTGLVTWITGTTSGIVTVKATYLGQSITTNVNITQ